MLTFGQHLGKADRKDRKPGHRIATIEHLHLYLETQALLSAIRDY